jgi:hypothetical protein
MSKKALRNWPLTIRALRITIFRNSNRTSGTETRLEYTFNSPTPGEKREESKENSMSLSDTKDTIIKEVESDLDAIA